MDKQPRVVVRPGRRADAPDLARLWWHAFPEKFGAAFGGDATQSIALLTDLLQVAGGRVACANLVAEVEGQVVGFLLLDPGQESLPRFPLAESLEVMARRLGRWGTFRAVLVSSLLEIGHPRSSRDQAVVELVGVDPVRRGQGVGRTLMEAAIARARIEGTMAVILDVAWGNEVARSLYESLGFEPILEKRSPILKWFTGYPGWTRMILSLDRV